MLRALFDWLTAPVRVLLLIVLMLLAGMHAAVACLLKRDEPLEDASDPPAIAAHHEADEDDDRQRQWVYDMSPEQRLRALGRAYSKQAFAPLHPFFPRWKGRR